MKAKLSKVDCKYGAPMGRSNIIPNPHPKKIHLQRLNWVNGDYTSDGTYFGGGRGDYIYWAHAKDMEVFVRARNRNEAKAEVRRTILSDSISFYR